VDVIVLKSFKGRCSKGCGDFICWIWGN